MAKSGRSAAAGELSSLQINAYALLMWPLCIVQLPLIFVVPYFAQVLGLNLAMLGMILLIGRLWDVVCDLSVAYLSDSWVNRFGLRRPWVVVGLPLFAIAAWVLFVPYPSMTMERYGLGIGLFFLTWTIAFIPYLSQGTELSTDPLVRNRVNIRQSFVMLVGFLTAYISPFLLVDKRTFWIRQSIADTLAKLDVPLLDGLIKALNIPPLEGIASYGRTMLVIVILTSIAVPICLIGYALFVPDRSATMAKAKGSMKDAFRNGIFLRFCLGYVMVILGYSGRSGLFPFLLAFWFKRADLLLVLVLIQYLTSIAATPGWAFLFKRLERKTCLAIAAVVEAFAMLWLALIPTGNDYLLFFGFFLIGLPGQTLLMASYLVAADSADYAKWKYRTESRAVHVSIVSLIVKLGAAGAALSIWIAGLIGFNPKLPEQTPGMIMTLKVICLYSPMVLLLAGAALVATYPMNRKRQAAIQRRLDVRASELAAQALTGQS